MNHQGNRKIGASIPEIMYSLVGMSKKDKIR